MKLIYRGGDSSTEGKSLLRRDGLVYKGGDTSMKGETRLQKGRLIYGGGDSSTKEEAHLGTILDAIGNVQGFAQKRSFGVVLYFAVICSNSNWKMY